MGEKLMTTEILQEKLNRKEPVFILDFETSAENGNVTSLEFVCLPLNY